MIDGAIRRALDLVERRYVEPSRVDAHELLIGALGEGARPALGATLVEAIAPPLERALDRAAAGPLRDARRAELLDGAVRRLDRFCHAASGTARRAMENRLAGRTGGIGLRIGRRGGRIRVLGVHAGSPASSLGLAAGDELVEVDGEPLPPGILVAGVLARLRGEPGTSVSLRVRGDGRPRVAARVGLGLPSVELAEEPGGLVTLRLSSLSQATPAELARRLPPGATPRGWLLDLRGNSGGSMLAAGAIAGRFLDGGPVVEALDARGRPVPGLRRRVDAAAGGDTATPLALLVDRRTASSAEALAAALVRRGRAVLLGERTFGKRLVQKLYPDPEHDLVLKLSVAFLRAAGAPLPPSGLEPDLPLSGEAAEVLERARRLLERHGHREREIFLGRLAPP